MMKNNNVAIRAIGTLGVTTADTSSITTDLGAGFNDWDGYTESTNVAVVKDGDKFSAGDIVVVMSDSIRSTAKHIETPQKIKRTTPRTQQVILKFPI